MNCSAGGHCAARTDKIAEAARRGRALGVHIARKGRIRRGILRTAAQLVVMLQDGSLLLHITEFTARFNQPATNDETPVDLPEAQIEVLTALDALADPPDD